MNERYDQTNHPCGVPRYSHLLELKRFYDDRGWGPFCSTPGSKRLMQRAKALDSAERSDPALYERLQERYGREFWPDTAEPGTVAHARDIDHGRPVVELEPHPDRAYNAVRDVLQDLKPHVARVNDRRLRAAFERITDSVFLGGTLGFSPKDRSPFPDPPRSPAQQVQRARSAVMEVLAELRPHVARAGDVKLSATFNQILALTRRTSRPRRLTGGYEAFSRATSARANDVQAVDIPDRARPTGRVVEAGLFDLAATERASSQFFGGMGR